MEALLSFYYILLVIVVITIINRIPKDEDSTN